MVLGPLWNLWPDITSCPKVVVLSLWDVLSSERTGLQFAVQSLNGPSRTEPATILYCLIWDSPNLEGQVPIFISPRNRVAQLYSMRHWKDCIKAIFLTLPLGKLHVKHTVWHGIWVPTKHLVWDQEKPQETLIELSCLRTLLYANWLLASSSVLTL
jgi:hypothetical protein